MDDDLMFQYLLQMGAMQPEQQDMARKQKMIDTLRGNAMNGPQGQMVGKHYVPPSLTQYMSQLGQGYMAGQAQNSQDAAAKQLNTQQGDALRALQEQLRRKRLGMTNPTGQMDTIDYGAGY
jgi:hypothetical protein